MYNYRMMNGDFFGSGGLFMMLLGFLFFIVILSLIISALRGPRMGHRYHHYLERSDPIDIAKGRYAKGEITKAEFEQIKKDLSE